jgi:virulence-associated protein VapD
MSPANSTTRRTKKTKASPSALPVYKGERVYAIAFDLETSVLERLHHTNSKTKPYREIRTFLEKQGFTKQQESLYFGDGTERTDPVACMLAVQELAKKYTWFAPAIKDIRLLQVTDQSDLKRVLP